MADVVLNPMAAGARYVGRDDDAADGRFCGRRADRVRHRLQGLAGRGGAHRRGLVGHVIGIPAFLLIIAAGPMGETPMFRDRHGPLPGLGAGLFGHGTLTATIAQRAARAGGPCAGGLGCRAGDGGGGSPWRLAA